MPPRTYANPEAFRQAREQRVRASAGAAGMGRFRQILVFDRFLARVFEQSSRVGRATRSASHVRELQAPGFRRLHLGFPLIVRERPTLPRPSCP